MVKENNHLRFLQPAIFFHWQPRNGFHLSQAVWISSKTSYSRKEMNSCIKLNQAVHVCLKWDIRHNKTRREAPLVFRPRIACLLGRHFKPLGNSASGAPRFYRHLDTSAFGVHLTCSLSPLPPSHLIAELTPREMMRNGIYRALFMSKELNALDTSPRRQSCAFFGDTIFSFV